MGIDVDVFFYFYKKIQKINNEREIMFPVIYENSFVYIKVLLGLHSGIFTSTQPFTCTQKKSLPPGPGDRHVMEENVSTIERIE
jgi:hypothetical protein